MARKRNPETEKRWQALLTQLDRSGQSVAEFAAQHGVSTASIYHWRKRLGRSGPTRRQPTRPGRAKSTRTGRTANRPATQPPFVRLNVASADRIEVELPSGVRIHVPPAHIQALQAAIGTGHALASEERPC